MAVDTPARIAVLGAGPVGLEAALYGRYLGYDVDVYERGQVADNLLGWGHVRLFSPWHLSASPLGIAALAAQDAAWRPPAADALLTGREMAEAYYLPLAASDLLSDSIIANSRVIAVGREGPLKSELIGDESRCDYPFRILLADSSGAERVATADVVIDATGTYGNHNWLGLGGIPAPGERAAAEHIEYGLPDILGEARGHYAGRRVLVIGAGYSAATSMTALAELAGAAPGTAIHWITREPAGAASPGPVPLIHDDRLPERDRVARAANALAGGRHAAVVHWPGTAVDAVEWQAAGQFAVRLTGTHAGTIEVDRIIANVGYRPDASLYEELQVHECYATQGPIKLASALLGQCSADCLDHASAGPESLLNPEPDFYILGSKSYGRNSRFLLSIGLTQIRDIFSIIGDRADLDVYRTFSKV